MSHRHGFASNFGCIPADPFGRTILNPGLVLVVPGECHLDRKEKRRLFKRLQKRAKHTHVAGECCTGREHHH